MALYHRRSFRIGVVAAAAAAVLIALIVTLVVVLGADEDTSPRLLIPCVLPSGKEENADSASCIAAGCSWYPRPSGDPAPKCVWSSQSQVYSLGAPTETSATREAVLTAAPGVKMLGQDYVRRVKVLVTCMTEYKLRIKYYDADSVRYEVPSAAVPIGRDQVNCINTNYEVRIDGGSYPGVVVIRKSTNVVIFNSSTPALAFTDQFIQLTVALNSESIYGFGEHNHERLRYDMNYKRWTIFSRDAAPLGNYNLYGVQTLYMNIEKSTHTNGVFLLNSNAMDIFLHPNPIPAITYRVLGGVLDFHVFLGPTPEAVVQQYTSTVGRMIMPPYWALGFMLSRWGYNSTNHIRQVVDRNVAAKIPLDVVYGDIEYMQDYMSFTYNNDTFKDLPSLVDELHSKGFRFVVILDPGIGIQNNNTALAEGVKQDVFIKYTNGSRFVGEVWPGRVYYPDFTSAATDAWWQQMIRYFYNGGWSPDKSGVKFDGLWVDMNEPANFVEQDINACKNNRWNNPPYIPPTLLGPYFYSKTVCMDTVQAWGSHYNVHNLYGHSMSMSTNKALKSIFPQKRPFVLTRSNYPGTAAYAAHWLGDNQSRWPQMKASIVGLLEFSFFGFGLIGSDICGFWYEADYEMCIRWTQLGAFYPFARNHNGKGDAPEYFKDQDPAAFNSTFVTIAKSILDTRYRLLPYLYTLFFRAHTGGSTVARPLLSEFTDDVTTHDIYEQFMWGRALLISPALYQGQDTVRAYIPKSRWFDYFTRHEVTVSGVWLNLTTPLDKTNLHIRGGYIIPWQEAANSTQYSRLNPFGVLAALDETGAAWGELFYDDGESDATVEQKKYLHLTFDVQAKKLSMSVVVNGYADACQRTTTNIVVLGISEPVKAVTVDGSPHTAFNSTFTGSRKDLEIFTNLPSCVAHVVEWK